MLTNSILLCFFARAKVSGSHICHATGLFMCPRTCTQTRDRSASCPSAGEWEEKGSAHIGTAAVAESIDQTQGILAWKIRLSCTCHGAQCRSNLSLNYISKRMLACPALERERFNASASERTKKSNGSFRLWSLRLAAGARRPGPRGGSVDANGGGLGRPLGDK